SDRDISLQEVQRELRRRGRAGGNGQVKPVVVEARRDDPRKGDSQPVREGGDAGSNGLPRGPGALVDWDPGAHTLGATKYASGKLIRSSAPTPCPPCTNALQARFAPLRAGVNVPGNLTPCPQRATPGTGLSRPFLNRPASAHRVTRACAAGSRPGVED